METNYKKTYLKVINFLLLAFLSCRPAEEQYINGNSKDLRKVNTSTQNFLESNNSGIIYRNPRVYNVDYSFELVPELNKIDRNKDLKLWVPIPREWDSQKAVKIISIEPEPHAKYVDPEHGNPMLFWDFGKKPEKPSYKVNIKFRLESYDINVKFDPNRVGTYDKTSREFELYTRSTHTIHITPKIRELAREAVGDETNPYLQAEQIVKFVRRKMRFKRLSYERGRGIDCLLAYPVTDKETGQEYYEGACNQYSALFIALCRAVGIPARSVQGFVGWEPWAKKEDLKPRYEFETKLSPTGLAGAQDFGVLTRHTWAEFYIPSYGWIPVDPQGGTFATSTGKQVIICKSRDIKIGPEAPQKENQGYGTHWIPLHKGRADSFHRPVWNIEKIHTAKIKTLHYSDPLPADGLAVYGKKPFTVILNGVENDRGNWCQDVLSLPSCFTGTSASDNINVKQFYNDHPATESLVDAFICNMLRSQLSDEKYFKLIDTYVKLRQESKQAVSTSHFKELAEDIYGKPLDWFFKQWIDNTEWPQLKLEEITSAKDKVGWQVRGNLLQLNDTTFRLPIEIAIDTTDGREIRMLWMEDKIADIDFHTLSEPQKLIVDPEYKVLKLQKMAPRLMWFWYVYPEYIIVYGTLAEATANKAAAERFCGYYLGTSYDIIKADTDVNDTDMKNKWIFLFGRPETNKVAQQFKDSFPIKFDGAKFSWQGTTYDKSKQGLAQVIENPIDVGGKMVMYAGLSPEATPKFHDLYLYDADYSYVIFDGDKQLLKGGWEDFDSTLVWRPDDSSGPDAENLP
jgi:hypothetical protein